MSGRIEMERLEMIESGSPLANHSMDDKNVKDSREGSKRFQKISRKAERASLRRKRRIQKLISERVLRMKDWVTLAAGSDSFELADFPQEISYLRRHGINIKSVLASKN